MVKVLGLDIGGANTKAAYLEASNGGVTDHRIALEYFPFWKRSTTEFCTMLVALKTRLCGSERLDRVAVTMTAELSDAYRTKREGVNQILDCVSQVFGKKPILVLDVNGCLRSINDAKLEPLKVAAANWAATGWMVAQKIRECVVVDVGSTSTSIIPIVNGEVAASGKMDLEKLMNGELVYTASLRTNVAAIVQSIPLRGGLARVSSELFAQSGDVHLILGNITPADYLTETADGKGKTRSEAFVRLSRVVCADIDLLSEEELIQIASYVYEEQIKQVAHAINQVYARFRPEASASVPTLVTGLGKVFLARKAAERAGVRKILVIEELLPTSAALASPAVGVALMAATKLEGRCITWTR